MKHTIPIMLAEMKPTKTTDFRFQYLNLFALYFWFLEDGPAQIPGHLFHQSEQVYSSLSIKYISDPTETISSETIPRDF